MIIATIYRTDAEQVAKDGPVAFRDMVFSGKFIGEDGVRSYCESLCRDNGIINPWIKIVEATERQAANYAAKENLEMRALAGLPPITATPEVP